MNLSLILAAEGAPEWIRLLPLGEVRLADGRQPFTVTSDSLKEIIRAWRKRGNDLVIDYEHQTLTSEKALAAGWIKELQIRDDGL
ncbi:MAG: phage protease, partial [Candidatus Cloacimonadaceae bacterium]